MNKQLGILVLLALLAVGGGSWLALNMQSSSPVTEKLFSPGINQVDEITEITLQNSQKTILQASLVDDKWMGKLPDIYAQYPLDKTQLANFLQTLVQANLAEAKTSKTQNYHHLGVESIDNIDSLATLVSIKFGNVTKTWQVLVGNKANLGEGTYVRLPTSSQSWLVDRQIELPSDEFAWLLRPLLPFKTTDVVSINRLQSNPWSISKKAEGDFVLNATPKGRDLRYPGIVNAFVSSLIELDFEKVLPLNTEVWNKAKLLTTLNIVLSQNESLQCKIASLDNDYFVQFSSPSLNGFYLDWTYKISAFNAQQLLKLKEDFLAELPQSTSTKTPNQEIDEGDAPH
jgi:hypothetical protein